MEMWKEDLWEQHTINIAFGMVVTEVMAVNRTVFLFPRRCPAKPMSVLS
jgi:hypothetical protein